MKPYLKCTLERGIFPGDCCVCVCDYYSQFIEVSRDDVLTEHGVPVSVLMENEEKALVLLPFHPLEGSGSNHIVVNKNELIYR